MIPLYKAAKFIERKNRTVITTGWQGGGKGELLMGTEF